MARLDGGRVVAGGREDDRRYFRVHEAPAVTARDEALGGLDVAHSFPPGAGEHEEGVADVGLAVVAVHCDAAPDDPGKGFLRVEGGEESVEPVDVCADAVLQDDRGSAGAVAAIEDGHHAYAGGVGLAFQEGEFEEGFQVVPGAVDASVASRDAGEEEAEVEGVARGDGAVDGGPESVILKEGAVGDGERYFEGGLGREAKVADLLVAGFRVALDGRRHLLVSGPDACSAGGYREVGVPGGADVGGVGGPGDVA